MKGVNAKVHIMESGKIGGRRRGKKYRHTHTLVGTTRSALNSSQHTCGHNSQGHNPEAEEHTFLFKCTLLTAVGHVSTGWREAESV